MKTAVVYWIGLVLGAVVGVLGTSLAYGQDITGWVSAPGYDTTTFTLRRLAGPTPKPTAPPAPTATPKPPSGTCSGTSASLDTRIGTREPPTYGVTDARWPAGSTSSYCLRIRGGTTWRILTFRITRKCGDSATPILRVIEPNGDEWTSSRLVRFQNSTAGVYGVRVHGGAALCWGNVEAETAP